MADIFNGVDLDDINAGYLEMEANKKIMKGTNTDLAGRARLNTMFGEGISAGINWEFNANFCYQGDTRKLQQVLVSGGTVSQDSARLKVSSGTNANGSARAHSLRALRYRPGQEAIAGFTFMFPNRIIGNKRYIGPIDDDNGFAFGVQDEEFGIFYNRGGVLTFIPQSDFNIDKIDGNGPSGFNINVDFLNIGRITYAYFGIAPPTFEVFVKGKGFIPVHEIDFINNSELTHLTIPYVQFSSYNINTGNTTNVDLFSGSIAVGIIGSNDRDISTRNFTREVPTVAISTGTISGIPNLQRLIVFQNKTTYGVVPVKNKIENLVNLITATTLGANKPVTLKRYRLAVAPTGGTWADQSINSIMRYSFNTAIDLTGAEVSLPIELGSNDKFFETDKIVQLDLRAQPGEYVAYVIETTSTAGDIKMSVGWKELF